MIQRFACLPKKITRRKFSALVGTAVGAEYLAKRAYGAGSPFTIALVPDPQYLAANATCGTAAYNALIQWVIDNRNLSVNGTALNVKGFLQVGDCCNGVSSSVYDAQQTRSVNAYALAEATSPKMFVARCVGNHDYQDFSTLDRNKVGYMWRDDTNGAWSPTNVASVYSGGMDLGNGDVAYFGGSYNDPTYPVSTANSYMRLQIQGRKILIISLEFFARTAVLTWAKTIHDTYTDHECWITTHGYMRKYGTLFDAGDQFSTAAYSMGVQPACNTGIQQQAEFATWSNVTGTFCGHDINGYSDGWVWQRAPYTSSSSRGQTVQQIFCDCQENDQGSICSGSAPDGTSDIAHIFLMRITPLANKLEAFLVSTNKATNQWTGGSGVLNQASPVQLFNVDFPALTALPTTMMSGAVGLRGAVAVQ